MTIYYGIYETLLKICAYQIFMFWTYLLCVCAYQQAQDLEDDGGPEAAKVRVTRECAQEGAHERGARHICDRIRGVSARLPPNLDQIDD